MRPYAKKVLMMFARFARVQTTEKLKLTRQEYNVPVLMVTLRDRGTLKPQ